MYRKHVFFRAMWAPNIPPTLLRWVFSLALEVKIHPIKKAAFPCVISKLISSLGEPHIRSWISCLTWYLWERYIPQTSDWQGIQYCKAFIAMITLKVNHMDTAVLRDWSAEPHNWQEWPSSCSTILGTNSICKHLGLGHVAGETPELVKSIERSHK